MDEREEKRRLPKKTAVCSRVSLNRLDTGSNHVFALADPDLASRRQQFRIGLRIARRVERPKQKDGSHLAAWLSAG